PAAVYAIVFLGLLLVVLWGPTPATRQLPYIIAFVVLLIVGVQALRRQTAEEFPDRQAGETISSIRASYANRGGPASPIHDSSTLLEAIERDSPDVVLTDRRMPPFRDR